VQVAGLQYIVKANFAGKVFTAEDVEEARKFADKHFSGNPKCFNYEGWKSLYAKYGGVLPLRIKAVKEGSLVGAQNAIITIENTDPEFYWLTNWAETVLLQVWYPVTVASLSRAIKQAVGEALVRTGDPSLLPYKLHDFGFRGVSSRESAAIGGAAHLFNFLGTDNLSAIELLQQYYHAEMPGVSIPASEHSLFDKGGHLLKSVEFHKEKKEWLYQLKSATELADRADAAVALGAMKNDEEVVAALGETLRSDKAWGVRATAADTLGQMGGPSASKLLLASLDSSDKPWVRSRIVSALGNFKDDTAVAEKLYAIAKQDDSYRARAAALQALGRLKGPKTFATLEAAVAAIRPTASCVTPLFARLVRWGMIKLCQFFCSGRPQASPSTRAWRPSTALRVCRRITRTSRNRLPLILPNRTFPFGCPRSMRSADVAMPQQFPRSKLC